MKPVCYTVIRADARPCSTTIRFSETQPLVVRRAAATSATLGKIRNKNCDELSALYLAVDAPGDSAGFGVLVIIDPRFFQEGAREIGDALLDFLG